MPCITVKTNCPISVEAGTNLKEQFGEIISLIPRKSEKWLMCIFEQQTLWLSGTNDPAAIVELQLFGKIAPETFAQVNEQLTNRISSVLNISPQRIYCTCFETPYWGWNGNPL